MGFIECVKGLFLRGIDILFILIREKEENMGIDDDG